MSPRDVPVGVEWQQVAAREILAHEHEHPARRIYECPICRLIELLDLCGERLRLLDVEVPFHDR